MAAADIDSYGGLFIDYMPGIIETLNNTSYARTIPLGTTDWQGDHLVKTLAVQRNPAIGGTTDGGALPVSGKPVMVQASVYRKFCPTGAASVTDGLLATAASEKNAAKSATDVVLTGFMESMRKFENGLWTRDGTGQVCALGQTVSGATITVSDARMMWDGKDFEIRHSGSVVDSFTVSKTSRAVDSNGEMTLTLSASLAASTQAAADPIYWGSGNQTLFSKALTGLDKLIDDASGTFQGVNVTTYPRYTSPVLGNSGTARPMTPSLFRQMMAMINQETGSKMSSDIVVLTSTWDMVNFEELYEGAVRITPDSNVVGLDAPTFQSSFGRFTPVTDPDCPYGKMFFIDRNEISYMRQKELDWRKDKSGSIFTVNVNNLSYDATALGIGELMIFDRRRCGKIKDLKFTAKSAY